MDTARLDHNPVVRKVVPITILGGLFSAAGILVIVFGGGGWVPVGISILAASIVGELVAVVRALRRVPCPRCAAFLRWDLAACGALCDRCRTRWEVPARR